MQDIKERVE